MANQKKLCMGCMEYYDASLDVCPHCGCVDGKESAHVLHMPPGTILHKRYVVGNALGYIDYTVIWRYFSWTNQTLAMIVLWAASMYLFLDKKNYWITAVPATFMSAVSITYFCMAPECLGLVVKLPVSVAYILGIAAAVLFLSLFLRATKKQQA